MRDSLWKFIYSYPKYPNISGICALTLTPVLFQFVALMSLGTHACMQRKTRLL